MQIVELRECAFADDMMIYPKNEPDETEWTNHENKHQQIQKIETFDSTHEQKI